MQERPTKKQHELLGFIDEFVKENGYGPSYREIMRGLDYKSVSTVAAHVDSLIERGWLTKKDNSARSLEVVDGGMSTTEQEINAKIAELQDSDGDHKTEVETLQAALKLLGYGRPSK